MRYLGIDYGTKRIGIALSDEEGNFAFPHAVIPSDTKAIETIACICSGERVGEIILGRSLNYQREENVMMKSARLFSERLIERTGLPLRFEDEVLTTREASRVIAKDADTDARAAALILGSFLNHR